MDASARLDAHAKPPSEMKRTYKDFQKLDKTALEGHSSILDMTRKGDIFPNARLSRTLDLPTELRQVFTDFLRGDDNTLHALRVDTSLPKVYEIANVPGLFVFPDLLPREVQLNLLDKLLLRDLSNPEHRTNVHMHYDVPYPSPSENGSSVSYFDTSSSALLFSPKDSTIHKPITTAQYLTKKLRWMTLGGQYDWTNKVYPSALPPSFPPDIKRLVGDIFPTKAEAAIVNLYSPGDTLSLHRDVSEECDQPLVSVSLGCDGVFVVGLDGKGEDGAPRVAAMRLRSGDAVLMSGASRYAWHGVPKIVEGTCPRWMQDWPSIDQEGCDNVRFAEWKGWMSGKRVNLNVRQMFA